MTVSRNGQEEREENSSAGTSLSMSDDSEKHPQSEKWQDVDDERSRLVSSLCSSVEESVQKLLQEHPSRKRQWQHALKRQERRRRRQQQRHRDDDDDLWDDPHFRYGSNSLSSVFAAHEQQEDGEVRDEWYSWNATVEDRKAQIMTIPPLMDLLDQPAEDTVLTSLGYTFTENEPPPSENQDDEGDKLDVDSSEYVGATMPQERFVDDVGETRFDQLDGNDEDGFESLLDVLDDDTYTSLETTPMVSSVNQDSQSGELPDELAFDVEQSFSATGLPTTDLSEKDIFHTVSAQRETLQIQTVIDHGVAILSAMREIDWMDHEGEHDSQDHDGNDSDEEQAEEEFLEEEDTHGEVVEDATNEDSEEGSVFEESLRKVEELLDRTSSGTTTLSSEEYNLLLLQLALSSLETDDALGAMMNVYEQMCELDVSGVSTSAPDISTFQILLHGLDRRGVAPTEAVRVCREMIGSGIELNSQVVAQGMRCFQRRNCMRDAEAFMKKLLDDDTRPFRIPRAAFLSLLHMFKLENAQEKAIPLLEACFEEIGDRDYRGVNRMLLSMIDWPRRDRNGNATSSSLIPLGVLEKLETFTSCDPQQHFGGTKFIPGFPLWRRLIIALSPSLESEEDVDWSLVRRAFEGLRKTHPSYWPDSILLKIGLLAARHVVDGQLASELIERAHKAPRRQRLLVSPNDDELDIPTLGDEEKLDSSSAQPAEPRNEKSEGIRIPPQAFSSAMHVCINANDMYSARRILDCLSTWANNVPLLEKSQLYTLAIKGYAKVDNSEASMELLQEMQQRGPPPTEEAYGAVIHSLAMAKKTEEACKLLDSMENGAFGDGVMPGTTCFNAGMLAYMQTNQWDQALKLQQRMRHSGIPQDSISFQGALVASLRVGGREKAASAVEEALQSDVAFDQGACELSMKILLRDIIPNVTLNEARQTVRKLGEQNEQLRSACLNLNRCLRVAQVEQKRQPSRFLRNGELTSRRQKAWCNAVSEVVNLARSVDETATF